VEGRGGEREQNGAKISAPRSFLNVGVYRMTKQLGASNSITTQKNIFKLESQLSVNSASARKHS